MGAFGAAAREAVETAWPQGRVYAPGKVPASPIYPYVVMYSDDGRDDTVLNDGTAGTDATRLMPMAVAETEDELDRATAAIKRGLRGVRLAVAGYDTTPTSLESSGGVVRDPDADGLLSKTLFFTFHTSPTPIPQEIP